MDERNPLPSQPSSETPPDLQNAVNNDLEQIDGTTGDISPTMVNEVAGEVSPAAGDSVGGLEDLSEPMPSEAINETGEFLPSDEVTAEPSDMMAETMPVEEFPETGAETMPEVPADNYAADPMSAAMPPTIPPAITPQYEEPEEGDSLNPPQGGGSGGKVKVLLGLTAVLLVVLAGTIWYFFLRPEEAPPALPTPTPSKVSPTPVPGEETHLECRFGLCIEVPGAGDNLCTSSFDCEQDSGTPTPTSGQPTTAPSAVPTTNVTATPTSAVTPAGSGAPMPTNTPAPTSTPEPTAVPSPTLVPTAAPSATPTPLATQLPESGTAENTLLFTILALMLISSGGILLGKRS